MKPTSLRGPFPLTPRGINSEVSDSLPGVYALGKTKNGEDVFEVRFVGRDDQDVKRKLKQHMAEWYPQFYYEYYSSKVAFWVECELYHDYNPPDNQVHPERPPDTTWQCPRCQKFK